MSSLDTRLQRLEAAFLPKPSLTDHYFREFSDADWARMIYAAILDSLPATPGAWANDPDYQAGKRLRERHQQIEATIPSYLRIERSRQSHEPREHLTLEDIREELARRLREHAPSLWERYVAYRNAFSLDAPMP